MHAPEAELGELDRTREVVVVGRGQH
jgi:hypothetical protein